ncbi:MAG: hypothetical protein RIC55_34235 [Pirellulaceae bacterium]
MNCDQVFDILTRGPFPAGESTDAPVERHLGRCHECRRLAEALRPAVELFHEAIDLEEQEQLPGYRGKWATADAAPHAATATATLTGSVRPASLLRRSWRTSWRTSSPARATALRMAAAGVLLGAVCVLLFGLGSGDARQASAPVTMAAAGAENPPIGDSATVQLLASLDLPRDCLQPTPVSAENAHGGLQCCTRCHANALSHTPRLTEMRLADLTRSCRACHES